MDIQALIALLRNMPQQQAVPPVKKSLSQSLPEQLRSYQMHNQDSPLGKKPSYQEWLNCKE